MRTPLRIVLLLFLMTVAGCLVVPPLPKKITPATSGRIVDASTHRGIAGASLAWLGRPAESEKKLDLPETRTEIDGRFAIPANNGHSGVSFVWMPPHGGYWEAGESDVSSVLLIEAPGYEKRIFDLYAAFRASHLKDKLGGDNILDYDKEFSVGDVELKPASTSLNQPPKPPPSEPH